MLRVSSRPLWRFVKIPIACQERRNAIWENDWRDGLWNAIYTSRFSRFANIFSYSRQFDDKCIAGFTPEPCWKSGRVVGFSSADTYWNSGRQKQFYPPSRANFTSTRTLLEVWQSCWLPWLPFLQMLAGIPADRSRFFFVLWADWNSVSLVRVSLLDVRQTASLESTLVIP